MPVLYLDEVNFTKKSIQSYDWSGRNQNISIDQRQIYTGYKSVIATVSLDRGKGLIHIFDKAVKQKEFGMYLRALSHSFHGRPIAIMMDNLSVHKTYEVREQYRRLKITPIWNASYSPDYNPIESCFSIVKREYCK